MSIRGSLRVALVTLLSSGGATAGIPTASMPVDDSDLPAPAPPASSAATSSAPPATTAATSSPAAASGAVGALPTNAPPVVPPAALPIAATLPSGPSSAARVDASANTSVMPSALVPTASKAASGLARLSLHVKEPGATVYVLPRQEDPEEAPDESAVMRCSGNCSLELPLGEYSVRVVTADGVRSYGELSLQSARWISVAPASTVTRDFGFVTGTVGTAATILGLALLGGAICDKCTATARDTGGAIALGVGLPMLAVGWSLYYIHRSASVDEQVLTQQSQLRGFELMLNRLPQGAAVGASLRF